VLIRQQRFDLRVVEQLCHELLKNVALLKAVAVLGERRRVPHRIVRGKPDEPAIQQIVVELLHQLSLRADAVEHLQQQRAQQPLRRHRRTSIAGVKPAKAVRQLTQNFAHQGADLAQWMSCRHTLLRRNVGEKPALIFELAAHASTVQIDSRYTTGIINGSKPRGFSADC
jgi:hypothetical protein